MKVTKKLWSWLLVGVLLIGMSVTPQGQAFAKAKVAISRKTATLTVGTKVKLKLNNASGKITWSSSNNDIASVGTTGNVLGRKAGTAKIIAKHKGKTYTCTVTVKSTKLLNTSLYVVKQYMYQLKLKNKDKLAVKAKWSSDNKSVATVNSSGYVTIGTKTGVANITAKVCGEEYTCKVTVVEPLSESDFEYDDELQSRSVCNYWYSTYGYPDTGWIQFVPSETNFVMWEKMSTWDDAHSRIYEGPDEDLKPENRGLLVGFSTWQDVLKKYGTNYNPDGGTSLSDGYYVDCVDKDGNFEKTYCYQNLSSLNCYYKTFYFDKDKNLIKIQWWKEREK